MKSVKRILSVWLCVALLCGCACGRQSEPSASTRAETTAPYDEPTASTVTDTTQETASVETQTDVPDETETAADEAQTGLNSTQVAEVLAFYQWAAEKNDKPQYTKTLALISMDGGEGKVAKYIGVFEPIAKKAVSKNTITGDILPGDYKNIRPSDWLSAEAVSDGTYTTITVQVAPQTDGAYGKEFDGPVGRSMTVLDGMGTAVNEMPGVSADFEAGDVEVQYQNPRICVRIDNRTGAFVPGTCTWSYRVHPVLRELDAKVLAFKVHLRGANGYIDYTMSY